MKASLPTARSTTLAADLRVVVGQLRRRWREEGMIGDLTPSQVSVLGYLERFGPSTVTALAKADGVRPQSMGATVAVLEDAGLVRGAQDPADGRQTIFSLTAKCRELVRSSRAAREDWLSRAIQSNFSAAEQEKLASGVALLKRLVALEGTKQ